MMVRRRCDIKQFCRDLFKDGNKQLHDIINCYEFVIVEMTKETFFQEYMQRIIY